MSSPWLENKQVKNFPSAESLPLLHEWQKGFEIEEITPISIFALFTDTCIWVVPIPTSPWTLVSTVIWPPNWASLRGTSRAGVSEYVSSKIPCFAERVPPKLPIPSTLASPSTSIPPPSAVPSEDWTFEIWNS